MKCPVKRQPVSLCSVNSMSNKTPFSCSLSQPLLLRSGEQCYAFRLSIRLLLGMKVGFTRTVYCKRCEKLDANSYEFK